MTDMLGMDVAQAMLVFGVDVFAKHELHDWT